MPLNDYTSGSVIGKGTYGVVSLVKHKKDRKQYVIKRVDIHNASSREQKAAEQEANLLSKIRHPNIVSYKESFQGDSGVLFIVMAFCEGGDMYTRLKTQNGTHLEERQIVEWFVQIAMALQYLHDRHVLHRDLKTQNIFLTKSKIIKVGDLGIARVLENASDMATTLIGTPYYMSPELFSNKPYSYKSDVWALGCCLYEMCTLKHAFNAKDMNSLVYKILKGKLPAMPKIYSNDLCDIIRSMLLQEPEKRPNVARLLRHPFIKKQIALFLEGTKNRQKNSSKIKEVQKKPISSEPGVMNKVENVEVVSRPEERNGKKPRGQQPQQSNMKSAIDADSAPNVKQEKTDDKVDKRKERKETKPKSDEKNNFEQRTSIDDDPVSEKKPRRSRPLPPKPPSSRPNVDLGALGNVPRERRRLKVSKPSENKGANNVSSPTDAKDSNEPTELKPKVSSGNPVSARERRRQRERESMGRPSLPSSISSSNSDRPLGPRLSNEGSGQSVQMSPVLDSVDGPPRRSDPPVKEVKIGKADEGVDVNDEDTSEGSDLEPSSQEEVVTKHQQRRKVSNDVNSLISALDTTLKLSDERTSPELNSGSVEEEPVEDISVSSGLLRNRIDFLRRDCIDGLGETDFQKACDIIDNQNEDNVELSLVELMGRKKFEKYGGKLWQLKFCETFKRT